MKKTIALLLLLALATFAMASCRKNVDPPEGSTESDAGLNMDPNGWTDN